MTGKEIYQGTKKFPFRLFILRIICAGGALVWFAILGLIGLAIKSGGLIYGAALSGLILYAIASSIVENYIGYMFKYGAVHAIAMAYTTGQISPTYFDDSVNYIKGSFVKANVYLVVDRLVNAAVRGVTKLVDFVICFLPDNIKSFVNTFINIYLNYIDECCLAYSMIHSDENIAKSSCDGIVLYYQNAKGMLMPALKTSIRVVLVDGAVFLLGFVLLFVFPPLGILTWLVGYSVVTPFLTHRVLCDTMVAYLAYATANEVRNDLYGTLMKVNPFKKLYNKQVDPAFQRAA